MQGHQIASLLIFPLSKCSNAYQFLSGVCYNIRQFYCPNFKGVVELSNSVVVELEEGVPRSDWMPWVVCLSAGLFFFYQFLQLTLFDVLNAPLRAEFQIDAASLSWMSSAYLWADILFLLPAGFILDRYSPRRVILASLLVCIAGTVGFALSRAFSFACAFHFLSGIGHAFCFLSCVVLVVRWFPPHRQALVIGSIVTLAFMGGMIAHTPLVYLYTYFGWREALLVDGSIGLIIFFWIYAVVQDSPKAAGRKNLSATAEKPDFLAALNNRQNWLAGLYTSCLNLPVMVLCALWGATYLETVHHLPSMTASNTVSLIFMGSIVGCPLMGWMSDRMQRRKPMMIFGAITTLLSLAPLFFMPELSETALSLLFFALGFFSSTQVIAYPLIAESNPISNTGAATSIASVIIMGGGGIGQVLFGMLMRHHAQSLHYSAVDFQFALRMIPIAALVALMAVLLTRETCR